MVSGTIPEDESAQFIPIRYRKTIQSIRDFVGDHSDADIYAVLKDTNMDPNETAQKLLNQDPFHEVKRKRDKRKEYTGHELVVDSRKHTESNNWEKSNKSTHLNTHRGFSRNHVSDARINKEFRVVRDNRVSQTFKKYVKLDSLQRSPGDGNVKSSIFEKRSTRILTDKLSDSSNFNGHEVSRNMRIPCSQDLDNEKDLCQSSTSTALSPEKIMNILHSSKSEPERVVLNGSTVKASSALTSSIIGVYSSSSDPVHVPSPVSRSAGTVGAIRREVGAVGVKKNSSDVQSNNLAVSTHSVILDGEVIASSSDSSRGLATNDKNSQPNQESISESIMPTTTNRRFAGVHNNYKHLQNFNHQRAMQPIMEWKPKNQKLKIDNSNAIETSSVLPSSNEDTLSSKLVDTIELSIKLSSVNIHGGQHVIIPQHLRVPEAECTKFTFGSFGDGSCSSKELIPSQQVIESLEQSEVTRSDSDSASVLVGPNEESSAEVGPFVDYQAGTSRTNSPASAEELERSSSGNIEPLNPQNIESYADIGLVQSHSPPYSSQQPQSLLDTHSMPNFSQYETEASYITPFFQTTLNDNVRAHCLTSPPEQILNLHAANINPLTTSAITQQQQQASQQQQQGMAQIYPQVHISHYPNFMPYRHILSPVYVPPMAMPSYSSNPGYAHPSTGSSYLLMPGGSSHLPTGGMKYAPSQYKPLPAGSPAGYGNYSSPAAYAIGTPNPLGGPSGLEDMTRIKFKDSNLYVPNQQTDSSEMWMQNSRELAGLQSASYYNLSGHAAHPTAFVSAHAAAAAAAAASGHTSFNAVAASGHTSFNAVAAAAQPSPMQYPGMYHTPQPASIATPHHLVHQQVPPPIGVAAGAQVGAFQQSQLGRLNWTTNF